MKLSKEEKKFWQRHFRIEKLENIPTEMSGYTAIDESNDDEFFYYLSKRVSIIPKIYLKRTWVTDEGVAHIRKLQQLKELTLRSHPNITKASIPYFNQMPHLERLNITRTQITLSHLCESLNNQNLKEVFLDSEENETEEEILEMGFILKERMPNCNIYLDVSHTEYTSGYPEKPIY
ncbi:MAG: hypothetical protein COA40_07825 [Aequorivita sp.]|nr:MAG: hypothetical protein COA40_07825 [Aequorivita sp.]